MKKDEFAVLKHLCNMLWRLFLYLKTDEQGTKYFLCAAVVSKALCRSCEAYWEKTSDESATISGSLCTSGCRQVPILPGYYLASNSHVKTCYFKTWCQTGFSKIRCCSVIKLQAQSVADRTGGSFLVEGSGSVTNFTLQEQCLPGTIGNSVMLKKRFLDIHLESTFGRVVQHFLQFNFVTKRFTTKLFLVARLEAETKSFYFHSFSHPRIKPHIFYVPVCSSLFLLWMNLACSYFLLSSVVWPRICFSFGKAVWFFLGQTVCNQLLTDFLAGNWRTAKMED